MKNLIILLTLATLCQNSQSTFGHDSIQQTWTNYNTLAYSHLLPPKYEAPAFNYQQNKQQSYQVSPREQFSPPSLHEPIFSEKQKEATQKQLQKEQQQFQFEKQQPQPFQQRPKPEEEQQQQQNQQKQQQSTSSQQQFSRDFQEYQKRFQQVQQQEYQERQQFKYEQQLQPAALQRGLQKIQQEQFEYQQQQQRQQQNKPPYQNYVPENFHNYKSQNSKPLTIYMIFIREPAPVQEFTDHIRPELPAKSRLPKPGQGFKPMIMPIFNADRYPDGKSQQSKFPNFESGGSYDSKDSSTFLFPLHPKAIPTEDLKVIAENAHNYVLYNRYKHGSDPQPISAQYFSRIYPVPSWGHKKYHFEPYHFKQTFVH